MTSVSPLTPPRKSPLPKRVRAFMETESAGGAVTVAAAVLALVAANSPLYSAYTAFVNLGLGMSAGRVSFTAPLYLWVQDGLMTLFFLTVGLELKREMREGFLKNKDQILLPLVAALAGMAAPSAVFALFNLDSPETLRGWAIPSATDIAFALAALNLFGKGLPPSVKIFLLAVAVFDDLGAIAVIAAFYNHGIEPGPLAAALGCTGVMALMNRSGIAVLTPYMLIGGCLWFCLMRAGIHSTLAGAVTGALIPIRNPQETSDSPVNRCVTFLHPWVSFMIMPFFAFVSAGVNLRGFTFADLMHPLAPGIALGLFLGKQIGVFGSSFALIRGKMIAMPEGAGWGHLYAVSVLAGIGFTMSLFIGLLAFAHSPALQEIVKAGVLGGTLLSTAWGAVMLRKFR